MKRIVTTLLLVLVAGSLVSTMFQEETAATEQNMKPIKASFVYYMHGDKRCPTCNKLESYAEQSLQQNFADAMTHKKLYWESVNFAKPQHEHFVKDFDLSYQMIVLVRYENGEIVRHKKLGKVWDLVGDETQYKSYIKEETETFFGDLIK